MSNAVKFTTRGQVRLTARPAKHGLRFVVCDTGAGFDEGDVQRLFRPFEQADASTTRRHGGTGLGLAICQSLIELMCGRISVRSRMGRGSAFAVFVPLTSSGEVRSDGFAKSAPQVNEAERAPRILLAEDHPTNQKVVAMILEPIGAELTIVDNGRAAVETARAGGFDLILMDIQMPVMDGLQAMTLIRRAEQETDARTPIICLTANAGEADARTCLAAGGDLHVAKPYRAETLLQAVFQLLASAEVQAADDPSIVLSESSASLPEQGLCCL